MKYRKHKQPSDKQLKVIALLQENPDMSLIKAGTLAGYSQTTAKNLTANVLNKPIVKSLLDNYRYELGKHNINPKRLASKLDHLLEATTKDKQGQPMPDNRIQLETVKVLNNIYGISADTSKDDTLKRRITLEEFEEKELST